MSEDIQKAKRMAFRLYGLGEKVGSPQAGELAQLLAGNAFFQNDKVANLIKLCLETSETKSNTAPLNRAIKLFMDARTELTRPFNSRSDCLQSCIYDVILCYVSFWGQLFEYYETMYYRPVELADGTVDTSQPKVSFEIGWQVTCLFVRDQMLSAAARAAGLSAGYDRSMSWFFYPANATSELEDAKALVLTVIGKIRYRGTILVAAEGMLGHISFGYSIPLTHWVEENLDKDWCNTEKMARLGTEYFETSSIRLNVNVNPVADPKVSDDILNTSFGREMSFLDGFEYSAESSLTTSPLPGNSPLTMSSRSISLNIRPTTPIVLGSPDCAWSGVDMGEFCRNVVETCTWPEVVNTVYTAGQIGISVINMTGDVVIGAASDIPARRRQSLSAPSRIASTPERPEPLLPFTVPTPAGMPPLEPLRTFTTATPPPTFGSLSLIPQLTPTPIKDLLASIPQQTPTPVARRGRESEITFFAGDDDRSPGTVSPLERVAHAGGALVALPSDADFDFTSDGSPSKLRRKGDQPVVATRPSVVGSPRPSKPDVNLSSVAECLTAAAAKRANISAEDWSLETALGDLLKKGKSLQNLYMHVISSTESHSANVSFDQNARADNGRKRKKSGGGRRRTSDSFSSDIGDKRTGHLPDIHPEVLSGCESSLARLMDHVEKKSLKILSPSQKSVFRSLARILALGSLLQSGGAVPLSNAVMQSIVAVAGDFTCFATITTAFIAPTDVFATGLRSAYVEANISMIEVAKDADLRDWLTLAMYYNDVSFVLLMGPSGLLQPTDSSGGRPVKAPQKLMSNQLSTWDRLPQHCLLVCSELLMRWAWTPQSRFWTIYAKLSNDYVSRRHGNDSQETSPEEVDEMNYFTKQVLMNAGIYLCDIADRLGASPLVIHGAFDLMRATILTRPKILQSRHVYHIVYSSLIAANAVFGKSASMDFGRIGQAAVVMQPDPNAQVITTQFIIKNISLSNSGAAELFSDGSGALVFGDIYGAMQPEFGLSVDLKQFFESVFVSEMRQVLYNMKKITMRRPVDHPEGDLGPFPEGQVMDMSVSPFSFAILSSGMALAMQLLLGHSGVQFKTVRYQNFAKAMPLVSPLGVLPCMLPPIKPFKPSAATRGDQFYKWFDDTVIRATKSGTYSIVQDSA